MLRVLHEKRGTTYTILGVATVQSPGPEGQNYFIGATNIHPQEPLLWANVKPHKDSLGRVVMVAQAQSSFCEGDKGVIYIGEDGWLHIREVKEFADGRFRALRSPTVISAGIAEEFVSIINMMEARGMAADGPVTPVIEELYLAGASEQARFYAVMGSLYRSFTGEMK